MPPGMTLEQQVEMEEAVDRGIEYLNRIHPGWKQKINLEDLDMSNCKECVMGQVFGDYYLCDKYLQQLDKNFKISRDGDDGDDEFDEWAATRGFMLGVNGTWEELVEIWKEKLQ